MIYLSHLIPDQEMSELFLTYPVGLETIEFSIASCLNHFTDTLHEYSRRIEQMNPATVSVHGPFLDLNPASYDSIIRAATRERFEQAYAAARALNATKIIYHSCFIPQINYYEGWIEQAVPFWKKFLDDKPTDITICMENVFDVFPSYIKEVIQQVNHPTFGVCFDLGHAHAFSDVPVTQWIDELGPLIRHIHIHDNDGTKDSHLAIGNGTIPWDCVTDALQKKYPTADFTIENNSREDFIQSLEFLIKNIFTETDDRQPDVPTPVR